MDLDDYKIERNRGKDAFSLKEVPELADYMRGRTKSIVNTIRRNLRFEIAFAILFLIFDCCMLLILGDIFYLRIFTLLLLIFCICFIYYVAKLLRYIRTQYSLDIPVKEQLLHYIFILSRFTRLYFQLTMVMIPLILLMAFIAGYLDQSQSGDLLVLVSSQTIWLYFGLSVTWSCIMYFVTGWYIKKLYGNHLNKLKGQLRELEDSE